MDWKRHVDCRVQGRRRHRHPPDGNTEERQLDSTGGAFLKTQIEALATKVLLGRSTTAILGNGKVEGLAFKDNISLDAELVVIAAGIRLTWNWWKMAGLQVNRGIVVNDHLEQPLIDNIFAVGECVEYRPCMAWRRRARRKGSRPPTHGKSWHRIAVERARDQTQDHGRRGFLLLLTGMKKPLVQRLFVLEYPRSVCTKS